SMLSTYFNSSYMDAKIDEIKTLIEPHVSADIHKMYTTQNFLDNTDQNITVTGGMGNQTIYGLKSFVSERNAYLTGVLTCSNGIDENAKTNLNIAPNPFENTFVVSSEISNIQIVDVAGKQISFTIKNIGNGLQQIELIGNSGYYFMNFIYNNKSENIKLVKHN
ncbi:MAG: T9SS type A sorting domain-containing protein, partial [Flavobacteriia bacterium]